MRHRAITATAISAPAAGGRAASRVAHVLAIAAILFVPAAHAAQAADPVRAQSPPATRAIDVVDVYHGVSVPDPYRWLEDLADPEVRAWLEDQDAFTRSILDAPSWRGGVRERLEELLEIGGFGSMRLQGERLFFTRRDAGDEHEILYVLGPGDAEPALLIDPAALGDDTPVALDWWYPSTDGDLLAYGTSEGGSEKSVLRVLDVRTLAVLPDEIPDTRAAGVAWKSDAGGFYYTRFPHPGEYPASESFYHRRVFYHALGTDPADDPLVYEHPTIAQAWPNPALSTDDRFLLIMVSLGAGRNDLYVQDLRGDGRLVPIAEGLDAAFYGPAIGNRMFMLTTWGAPAGRVFSVDLERPARHNWREIVPEKDHALTGVLCSRDRLLLHYLEDAHSKVSVVTNEGEHVRDIGLPTYSTLHGWAGDWRHDETYLHASSNIHPPAIYRHDPETAETVEFARIEAPIDTSLYTLTQVRYDSKDGTEVSMFLAHRKDIRLDGTNPTLLNGYGGFDVSMTPEFARNHFLWFEQGGVLAVPNLRGGGEYGREWYRAGIRENKQNTFDDFIAAAEWLIDRGYTSPERLAVIGGSNGGLLVGAFITQRPELAAAAVCQVPLLDMIRFTRFYGAEIWSPEYGDPENPEDFRWLSSYSPYHHVEPGVPYPAVLFTTAESDSRVHPCHAMKMAARLQTEGAGRGPVLLRYERQAGHGSGKPMSKITEELVDQYVFLFRELGIAPVFGERAGASAPGSLPGRG